METTQLTFPFMNQNPNHDPADVSSTVENKPSEEFPKLHPWSWIENGMIMPCQQKRWYQLRSENRFEDAIAIAREYRVL
jgi:hypothetical protein